MLERRSGSIINIASLSAIVADIGRRDNAHCASKGAVVAFTREPAT